MANFFDQFDVNTKQQPQNFFDQFDVANNVLTPAQDAAMSFGSGVVRSVPETIEFLGAAAATLPSAAISASRGQYEGIVPEFQSLMQERPLTPVMNMALGEAYQPQTDYGRYARSMAAGLSTGAIGGVAGAVSGLAGGAGAEAGGDIAAATAGEEYRPVGGLIGALAGGGATYRYGVQPVSRGVSKPTTQAPKPINTTAQPNIILQQTQTVQPKTIQTPIVQNPVRTALEGQRYGVSDVEKAGELQNLIRGRYAASERLEGALWNKVRQQAEQSSIAPSSIKNLQDSLMDAQFNLTSNEAAGIVDRQLAMLNRFAETGEDIPANMIVGMRRTLSKASQKEGGLRGVVNQLDDYIAQNLDIPDLPKAIQASRKQFETFQDPKSVAKAIEDGATASEFSRALFQAGNPALARGAARSFDEAIKAVGPRRAAEAQRLLDEATVNRIFEVARNQGSDNEFWIGKIAEQVGAIRNKNPELWNKLTPQTRDTLSNMESRLRAEGQSGFLNKTGEALLNQFVGLPARAIGLRTNLQLPSTLAPKKIANIDDIVKYTDIPQGVLQRASGLARNIGEEVAGNVRNDLGMIGFKSVAPIGLTGLLTMQNNDVSASELGAAGLLLKPNQQKPVRIDFDLRGKGNRNGN